MGSNCNLRADRQGHYQTKPSGNRSRNSWTRRQTLESSNPVPARFWVIVKESPNRTSHSTKQSSRELLQVSLLNDLFHPGYRVPPPKALTYRHNPGFYWRWDVLTCSETWNAYIQENLRPPTQGSIRPLREEGKWSCSVWIEPHCTGRAPVLDDLFALRDQVQVPCNRILEKINSALDPTVNEVDKDT